MTAAPLACASSAAVMMARTCMAVISGNLTDRRLVCVIVVAWG